MVIKKFIRNTSVQPKLIPAFGKRINLLVLVGLYMTSLIASVGGTLRLALSM